MTDVVISGAARTPVGSFGGVLAEVSAVELGAIACRAALTRSGVDPGGVDEVILGNVLSAGLGQNPARQVALAAALPETIPATTINTVCGSGLKAVAMAAASIRADEAQVVVAGGTESMSRSPYLLERARFGYRMGDGALVDSMVRDGLWCAFGDYHMGRTAENVASTYGVDRETQDTFAAHSQEKTKAAMESGRFADEITPVTISTKKGDTVVEADEHPRPSTTLESLAKLRPAFTKDGCVTAGNSSGINDGAAVLIVENATTAKAMGRAPLATIRSFGHVGLDPAVMGMGPVGAVRQALAKANLSLKDIDIFELNEAFAAQSVAVARELGVDAERVNPNGGAIALGHPIGASGARILVTLLYELRRRELRYGVAALCVGGGQGVAMVVERVPSDNP